MSDANRRGAARAALADLRKLPQGTIPRSVYPRQRTKRAALHDGLQPMSPSHHALDRRVSRQPCGAARSACRQSGARALTEEYPWIVPPPTPC